jgi:hypothetical protein
LLLYIGTPSRDTSANRQSPPATLGEILRGFPSLDFVGADRRFAGQGSLPMRVARGLLELSLAYAVLANVSILPPGSGSWKPPPVMEVP